MPNGEVHVIPLDDLVDHVVEYTDCVCGPTSDPVLVEGSLTGFSYVHHSLDNREKSEGWYERS